MVKAMPTEEFLVSFLVDARGGYMQAQRLPQLKIFVPPDAAPSPTRIICHLLKPDRLNTLPELNDCDGFASRILQIHSSCPRFQKPILIEVPHIASLRNGEREIVIMRKNYDSQNWKEHTTPANKDNLKEIFGEFYDSLTPEEELSSHRVCRIVTNDIPNYFCLVSRFQRDSCLIGQEGGSIDSKVDSRIKIRFPPGALMKKIQISLEVQNVDPAVVTQVLGDQHQITVSPIITVEPKRRKFRDLIEIQMPLPKGVDKTDISNLRILFSISEFVTKWEDVTNSTELLVQDDYVSHSTKISARVWLISAPGIEDVSELANRIYAQHCCTPYIGHFLAFARRHETEECQLRLLLITDDSADKTLECQESFELIATGPEVEIISKLEYQVESAGNLVTVTKSDETIQFPVQPFLENRLTVPVRMRNHEEPFAGKVAFVPDYKSKNRQVVRPITTLDIEIPEVIVDMIGSLRKPTKKTRVKNASLERIKGCQAIAKTELDLQMVAEKVGGDWPNLAQELGLDVEDVNLVLNESCSDEDKAFMTLIQWQNEAGNQATGNELNRALRSIGREDVVKTCMGDISFVEDEDEARSARERLKAGDKSFHNDIWDEVMQPKETPAIYSESVNESMIAETGDDWSEINKEDAEQDKYLSDDSDEKSLVATISPERDVLDDPELLIAVNIKRDIVPENKPTGNKTAAFMSLISEMDKAIPEPILYDPDTDQDGPEESQQEYVHQQPVMSCMPGHMNFEVEEEFISPVNAKPDRAAPMIWTKDESPDDDDQEMFQSDVYRQPDEESHSTDSYPKDDGIQEPMETCAHQEPVMSCLPTRLDDEVVEEFISPVQAAIRDECVPKMTFKEDREDDDDGRGPCQADGDEPINTDLDVNEVITINEETRELTDPLVDHDDVDDCKAADTAMVESDTVPSQSQRYSVLHEVVESEPQNQTEVEETVEVLPDGSIMTRKIVKQSISHMITEKTTREISPEEEEDLRARISEEPAEIVETEQELEDGSIVRRVITTIKTNSITSSKSVTDHDEGCPSSPANESLEAVTEEGSSKPSKKQNKRKNKKNKSKGNQM